MLYTLRKQRKISKMVQNKFKAGHETVYIMNKVLINSRTYSQYLKTYIVTDDDIFDKLTDKEYRLYAMIKRSDLTKELYLKDIEQIAFYKTTYHLTKANKQCYI